MNSAREDYLLSGGGANNSVPINITALPKVSLHDHLDGGLRTSTILELAGEIKHTWPDKHVDEPKP